MPAPYDNAYVANIFLEMSELLSIEGGDPFRSRAFKRTAQVINTQREPLARRLSQNALVSIKGIGEGSLSRIKDILRTGTCAEHQRLVQKLPPGVRALLDIKGVGARYARLLYHHGNISSLPQLQAAAQSGALYAVPGLPADFSATVLQGIALLNSKMAKVTLHEALRLGAQVIDALKDDPGVSGLMQTGSARRRKKAVGDLDVLVGSEARGRIVERFTRLENVEHVFVAGDGRASVRLVEGVQFDLRVIPPEQFGAGMHYFTGSRAHNIAVRLRANRRNLKVSDHGIFRLPSEERLSPGRKEVEIFEAVGLPFIPPELREDMGEIEAALAGKLPTLIGRHDVFCDHLALTATGPDDLLDVAEAARALRHREVLVDVGDRAFDESLERDFFRTGDQTGIMVTPCRVAEVDAPPRPTDDEVFQYIRIGPDDAPGVGAKLRARIAQGVVHAVWLLPDADIDVGQLAPVLLKHDIAVLILGAESKLTPDDALVRALVERGVRFALASGATDVQHLSEIDFAVYVGRRGWLSKGALKLARRAEHTALERRAKSPAALMARLETNTVLQQLRDGDIDDALVARAKAFIAGTRDTELESALAALTDNPLQAAFNLVMRANAQVLDDND